MSCRKRRANNIWTAGLICPHANVASAATAWQKVIRVRLHTCWRTRSDMGWIASRSKLAAAAWAPLKACAAVLESSVSSVSLVSCRVAVCKLCFHGRPCCMRKASCKPKAPDCKVVMSRGCMLHLQAVRKRCQAS